MNADGEVFGHPGLYVADAAALPKSPGTPPSMTIAAWSSHLATRFIARRNEAGKVAEACEVAEVAE